MPGGEEGDHAGGTGGEAEYASAASGSGVDAAGASGGTVVGEDGKELTEEEQRAIRRANRKRKSGWEVPPDPQQPAAAGPGDAVLLLQQQQAQAAQAAQASLLQRASMQMPANMMMMPAGTTSTVPGGRLYVGSLQYEITELDLRGIFSSFGPIKTIDMSFEPATGKSKGFAFVEFFDALHAEACQRSMDGFQLAGRPIKIGRPHGAAGGAAMPTPSPLVAGLNFAMPAVFSMMPLIAPGLPAPVLPGAVGGLQSAGALLAAQAVAKLQQQQTTGPPPPQTGAPSRIYVGSVMFDIGEIELKGIFGAFGPIKTVNMIPNPETGKHKGYGFIDFELPESAQNAIQTMNGFDLAGRCLKVGWANSAIAAPSPAISVDINALAAAQKMALTFGGMAAAAAQPVVSSVSSEDGVSLTTSAQKVALMHKLAMSQATKVVCLKNMVDPSEVDGELEGEIREECTKHGAVDTVVIEKLKEGGVEVVKIFVLFGSTESSAKAIKALDKRWFGGKVVQAIYYDEGRFAAKDYTG